MFGMENGGSQTGTRAKSALRALELLDVLAACREGMSFADLARALEVPKSSLHELLSVLLERSYVEYDATSRGYMLGIRTWETGQAYLRHHDLVRMARPVMEQVVQDLNETVQLAMLDGIENVYLAKVDCSHPLRLQSEVGRRLYAHGTGLGKVLLAALSEADCRARLARRTLPSFTPRTITDLPRLLDELAQVREQGFALDNEEYTPGLRCLAVPIRGHHDLVVAALSVSIPVIRAQPLQMARALSILARSSLEVARRLGCRQDDPCLARLSTADLALHALMPYLGSTRSEEVVASS
jgi:DNA-binding IclR family transcriptional regulator